MNHRTLSNWAHAQMDAATDEPESPHAHAKEYAMKLTEMFPSKFIKSADVTDAGGSITLKIKSVAMKEMDNFEQTETEVKPVVLFDTEQKLVLNKTNGMRLAELYGNDTDAWAGQDVTLVVEKVQFGSKMVDGLRVALNANAAPQPGQTQQAPQRTVSMDPTDGQAPAGFEDAPVPDDEFDLPF